MAQIPLAHERISRILALSTDYKKHKEMLREIGNRSVRANSVARSESEKIDSLVQQRDRYKSAVKRKRSSIIELENQSLAGRIFAISTRSSHGMRRSGSAGSLKSLSLSYPMKKSESRKSEVKPRKKEKKRDLVERLKKANLKDYGLGLPNKDSGLNNEYKKSIRKFSEKNKSIRTSLLEQGLKIERDYFMFLPNLKDPNKKPMKSHSKKAKP